METIGNGFIVRRIVAEKRVVEHVVFKTVNNRVSPQSSSVVSVGLSSVVLGMVTVLIELFRPVSMLLTRASWDSFDGSTVYGLAIDMVTMEIRTLDGVVSAGGEPLELLTVRFGYFSRAEEDIRERIGVSVVADVFIVQLTKVLRVTDSMAVRKGQVMDGGHGFVRGQRGAVYFTSVVFVKKRVRGHVTGKGTGVWRIV